MYNQVDSKFYGFSGLDCFYLNKGKMAFIVTCAPGIISVLWNITLPNEVIYYPTSF